MSFNQILLFFFCFIHFYYYGNCEQINGNLLYNKFYFNESIETVKSRILHKRQEIGKNCVEDVIHWLTSLANETWALEMLDATGKLPSGIMKLNLNSFGQYDQCMSIKARSANLLRQIKGKHCLARLPLDGFLEQSSSTFGVVNDRGEFIFNLGICAPDSCSGGDLVNILGIIFKFIGWHEFAEKTEIIDEFCSTSDGIPWQPEDWGCVAVLVFFLVIVVLSTCYDAYYRLKPEVKRRGKFNDLCLSFSAWKNTETLFKINAGSLKCLHGIRTITMFWIIMGHRYQLDFLYPTISILDYLSWIKTFRSMFVVGAPVAVDTFFFLSGFLLPYVFFKKIEKSGEFGLVMFWVHRILRLLPPVAIMVFIQSSLWIHFGSGPWWIQSAQFLYQTCRQNWWTTLLFVQNYVNPNFMCVAPTWYIAVDTQLYILSPILLYPLWKSRKYGLINLAFWMLAFMVTLVTIIYLSTWPAASFPLGEGAETRDQGFYYATHMRAMPWMIGFAFGYMTYVNSKRRIRMNKYLAILLWLISLTVMGAVVFGVKPLQDPDHVFNQLEDSTYLAFARCGWTLAIAWIVVACTNGYSEPVNWFLGLAIWEVMGRLCYCMYLLHIMIQAWSTGIQRTVGEFSVYASMYNYFGDLVFVSGLAYFLSMMFEFPIANLERIIFHNEKPKIAAPPVERRDLKE